MDFFTADYHLGHKNIIKYCNRPFANTQEMDQEIMANLLSATRRGDTLYFLGDLTFNRDLARLFCETIHGRLRLVFIKGNHDREIVRGSLPGLDQVDGLRTINVEGQRIVLCHYAMRVWDRSHHGSWQLHGHSHGTLVPRGFQYDVGVDNNEFMPVSFEQIKEIMSARTLYLDDYHGREVK